MKILLLLTLGLALCSAVPQGNEARPRMRGPRRFPLATPGLQSVNRAATDAAIAEELVEEIAPSRGASRGTSLPRRGRPTLRPRASIQVEEVETVPSTARAESGRSGLQLRRPRTRTTTTTTSAPPPPVEEIPEIIEEMPKEELIVMEEKMEKHMPEEKKMMEQVDETIPVVEMEMPEEIKETMVKEAPVAESPKPKLRPIPIKLGRRGQGAQPAQQLTDSHPESTQSEEPSKRHRFSVTSESGGPLRVRGRGRESANQAKQPRPAEETSSAAQSTPRVRRPSPPKLSSRISSRRTPPIEETIALEQEVTDTEHSKTNLNEIQKTLDNDKQLQVETVSGTASPEVDIPQDTTMPTSRTEESSSFDDYEILASQLAISHIEGSESVLGHTSTKEANVLQEESNGKSPPDVKEVEPKVEIAITPLPSIDVPMTNLKKSLTPPPTVIPNLKLGLPQILKLEDEDHPVSHRPRSEVNPRRSKNNFRGSEVIFRGGEPQVTLIGTLEDTPANEIRVILSGLGSRRRGLGRPLTTSRSETTLRTTTKKLPQVPIYEDDLNYDYYADLYEEEPIRKL